MKSKLQYLKKQKTGSLLNPNLPNSVNFVPFGMMSYSLFDINLINIHEHDLHIICIFVILFVFE